MGYENLPAHWKLIPMKRVVVSRRGGVWGDDTRNNSNDIICMRVADFDFSKARFRKDKANTYTRRNYTEAQIANLSLRYGDILIEKSGGGDKSPVGRAVLFDLPFVALFANFMDRLQVNTDIVTPEYFVYYWKAMYSFNVTRRYIKQTIGIQNFDISALLSNEIIPVPPIEEQRQIARFLDWKITAIDRLTAIRREELRNLADLKKALITREVTRGNWERVRLGSFCMFQNGISESGDFFTFGTPFVGYKDVYRHSELPETVSGVAMSNEKQQKILSVQKGDIFFTRTSETIEEIWMAAVCKHTIDKAVFSGFLIRCRPRKNIVDVDYMKYYLQALSVRNYFSSQTNIVIRASLSQNLLKRLPVPIPPMSEQKRIADYLDRICTRIDSAIMNFTQQIDTLKELKARLISDTVTGKIDVRNISVSEQERKS